MRAGWVPVLLFCSAAASGWAQATATGADGSVDALVASAEQARAEGRLEDAAGLYRDAVRLRPGWADGHWALATLLYDLDRYEEATIHFGAVLTYRPDDALALALKGLCEVELGNFDRALTELQRAYGLGIADQQVLAGTALQIAGLVNRMGNHEAALRLLAAFALQGDDRPPVILSFGLAMLRIPVLLKEADERQRQMAMLAGRAAYQMAHGHRSMVGRLALEELVSHYPAEPGVHYAFGVFLKPEDRAAAIAEYRRELEISPDHFPSMLELASLEMQGGGDLDEALRLVEQARQVAPESPAVYLVMGRVLIEKGDSDAAIVELERGAAMAPDSPHFPFALAKAYRRSVRPDDAERARSAFEALRSAQAGVGTVAPGEAAPRESDQTATDGPSVPMEDR